MITDIVGTNYDGTADNIPTPTTYTAPVLATTNKVVTADVDGDGILSVGDTITVAFDKALDSTANITEGNFTVENGAGAAINVGTTFTATVDGSNVVLTFDAVNAADALPIADAINGTYASVAITGAGSNITNLWGNEIGDVAEEEVTVSTTNVPNIASASFDSTNKKLYVTFDEAVGLTATGALTADNSEIDAIFELTGGYDLDSNATANAVSIALDTNDTTNKTIVLTLATGEFVIDEGITTLNIIAGGATDATVLDFEGNGPKRTDATGVVIGTYVAP
jgi:hypothetical protein